MAPPKTALLIIDMQVFFESMTKSCLSRILTLSRSFSSKDLPQLFTQHGHPPSDFHEPITNQLVRKWGSANSVHRNTEAWALLPEISQLVKSAGAGGEKGIVHKNVYDAFVGTDLEERLKDMGVERVVITGVMTDCCCDSTGRSAFNRGFETWMVSDATGSVDREQHEAGLKAWGFGYGDVITMKEVLRRLESEECKEE